MIPDELLAKANPNTVGLALVADFEFQAIIPPPGTKAWPRPADKPRPTWEELRGAPTTMNVEFEFHAIQYPPDVTLPPQSPGQQPDKTSAPEPQNGNGAARPASPNPDKLPSDDKREV